MLNNKILIVTKNTNLVRGEVESRKSGDMWVVAGTPRIRVRVEGAVFEQGRLHFQCHDWICNRFRQYIWGNKCKNSPHERLQSETFLWMRLAFLVVRRILLCYLTKRSLSVGTVSITLWDTENNNVRPSEAKTSTLTVAVATEDYVAATAAVSWLPAEAYCWIDSKSFGKFESFTQPNA